MNPSLEIPNDSATIELLDFVISKITDPKNRSISIPIKEVLMRTGIRGQEQLLDASAKLITITVKCIGENNKSGYTSVDRRLVIKKDDFCKDSMSYAVTFHDDVNMINFRQFAKAEIERIRNKNSLGIN